MPYTYTYEGVNYSANTEKHAMLEIIFRLLTYNGVQRQGQHIPFTMNDVARAYNVLGKYRNNVSSTIVDMTHKDNGRINRVPRFMYDHGYDLRKETKKRPGGESAAGVFIYVGIGADKGLRDWVKEWPEELATIVRLQKTIPPEIEPFIRTDEGSLFTVIDYGDVLSQALFNTRTTVLRVQNPVKWQPNEIDGLYFSRHTGRPTLYIVEAKALSTGDHLNLAQLWGALQKSRDEYAALNVDVVSLGIQMLPDGMNIGVFGDVTQKRGNNELDLLRLEKYYGVIFDAPVLSWSKKVKKTITDKQTAVLKDVAEQEVKRVSEKKQLYLF